MKKFTLLLAVFILMAGISFSQNLMRDDNVIPRNDNSQYAKDLQALTNAKVSKNETLFKTLSDEFTTKYSSKLSGTSDANVVPGYIVKGTGQGTASPNWGPGDVKVHSGSISSAPAGSRKQQIMRTDTLGNLYIGLNNITNDSLFFYKSVNQGASWTSLYKLAFAAGYRLKSFDFYISDSTNNTFQIGMICSFSSTSALNNSDLWYGKVNSDGSSVLPTWTKVLNRPYGQSFSNPSIVSDAYVYNPTSTYWYIAFQRTDSASGVNNLTYAAYTYNWGQTWVLDTVRSGLADTHLTIDFQHYATADTLNVGLMYAGSLRCMRLALSNFGTAASWVQNNVSDVGTVDDPHMGINRQDNTIFFIYTLTNGSFTDIVGKTKTPTVGFQAAPFNVVSQGSNVSYARLDVQQSQGAYRIAYKSGDTIKYLASFTPTSMGTGTIVSQNVSSGVMYPSVVGYSIGAGSFSGGVSFAGLGPTNIFYDGSGITPVGITNNTGIATKYDLKQNYPNPFNPSTVIKFSIPASEYVSLKVYDILGKEVTTLINSKMSAGSYDYKFDASMLSAGVYFYKLQTDKFSSVKKMLLIK
jgi:hypothetical protein